MDTALLMLRVIVGLLVAGHGSQKLFGGFGGPGLAGFTGWVASMGFRPARFWAVLGSVAEFGGGMLLALGLFSPLGSLGIAASMLTAIAKAHWPKIWVTENGMELPLTNLAAAAAVGIAGPGIYSLDALLGTALPGSVAIAALALTLAGVVAGLVVSRRPVQKETAPRTVGVSLTRVLDTKIAEGAPFGAIGVSRTDGRGIPPDPSPTPRRDHGIRG